jgi:hypothetical protein
MKAKNISKFVLKFLEEHKNDSKITVNWKSAENLTALENLFKKNKKSKDLNKPKRGKSSFLHFCDDFKPIVKQEFPDYTNKELLSYLGSLWKNYKTEKPDIVKKYEAMAKEQLEKYKKQMSLYKDETDIDDNQIETLPKIVTTKKNVQDEDDNEKKETLKKFKEKNKKESSKEKILESHLKTPEVVSSNDSDKKGFEKYVKKRKNRFIEEYPELNNEQLFEKMKKKWRSLSDEKKQKYL